MHALLSTPAARMPADEILQAPTPFAESYLWTLQARYFEQRGHAAWRDGEVPHYITSNPCMARTYAALIAAWRSELPAGVPLTILELGAGSGRFAFHLLRALRQLLPPGSFRYILSDYADSNVQCWQRHERFADAFADGSLQAMHFDACRPPAMADFDGPLVVVANYLFDSIPQELYHLRGGCALRAEVGLRLPAAVPRDDPAAMLAALRCDYYECDEDGAALEAPLAALLDEYRSALDDTWLLFPAAGLRCLAWLQARAPHGMLLLSADKGEHSMAALRRQPPPDLDRHGSFSLQVNYHALARWCENAGGRAFLPPSPPASVGVCALQLPGGAAKDALALAYEHHVARFGPDDFYTIIRHAFDTSAAMPFESVLACLRFARGDAHQLYRFMPRLLACAAGVTDEEAQTLEGLGEAAWENYFPLGEAYDWCANLAFVLHNMHRHEAALRFYRRSEAMYGGEPDMLFNQALCQQALARHGEVARLAARIAALEPDYPGLEALSGR